MDIFNALAEPTRRHIIKILAAKGQLPATAIYREFPLSQPAISQHLKILREAKLLVMEKRAQRHIYKINTESIGELEQWARHIRKLWDERLNKLDELIKS